MTASKPLSFSEALAEVKKADSNGDGRSRFVETGEGLNVEHTEKDAAAPTTKPKLVPIEDILLDILEEEDGEAGDDGDEETADES